MFAQIMVLHGIFGATLSVAVSFLPGPVASSTSSIAASPASAVADGNSPIRLTVTALDAYGNAVGNANVNFAVSGGNNVLTPGSGATDANGQLSTTLTSTQVQSEAVTATFGAGASVSVNVNFVAGAISVARSTLTVSPSTQTANNSNTINATLTLQDALGHPISGLTPSFTASGSSTSSTAASATNASGQTSALYTSTLAQSENVIATAGATSFTQPITFVAGPADNAHSTLTASPNSNIYASGTQPVTLVATFNDVFGNPVGNQYVAWSASNGNNTFTPPTTKTTAAGVATTQMTAITAGSRIAQGNLGSAMPSTSVTFIPGGYAPNSSFVASPNQVPADGNTKVTLTLTVRDGNSTLLPNAAVRLVDAVANHVFLPTSGTTDSNGMFVASMTGSQAGKQTVTAYFSGAKLSTAVTFSGFSTNCTGTPFYNDPPWPIFGATSGRAVVSADFNGDGNNDLAVLNFGGSVRVLLSRGNQLFATPVTYSVGGAPTAMAVGDVNKDGIADIATCNAGPNTVSLLIGNANGTFQPAATYAVGPTPRGIVIKDLNSDGNVDIATTNQNSNTVSVLYNAGNGLFNAQTTFPAGPQPYGIAAATIVNNNANDLIVTNYSTGQVSLLINTGGNTFSAPIAFSVGTSPTQVAVADLNGDYVLDVVVANTGETTVSVLMNQNNATFAPQIKYNQPFNPDSLALAAMNGYTVKDIVTASSVSAQFFTLANVGNGNFTAQNTYSTANTPQGIVLTDLNHDNVPDVVLSNGSIGSMASVFYNRNNYSFLSNASYAAPAGVFILSGDYDNDGLSDVFVTGTGGPSTIYWGQLSSGFAGPTNIPVGALPSSSAQGDFNADGLIDFVILNRSDNTASVVLNQNNRSFASQVTYPTGPNPYRVAVGDLDGDNTVDIAVTNYNNNTVSFLKNAGNGIFSAVAAVYNTGRQPNGIALADFNADGLLDLAVANSTDNTVTVAMNQNNTYSFSLNSNVAVGAVPASLATVDVDGDGLVDLVSSNVNGGSASILKNSNNSFSVTQTITLGTTPSHLIVSDMNGDAFPDLVVPLRGDNALAVCYGSASGTFGAPLFYATKGTVPASCAVADFDSNGYVDFACVHPNSGTLNVSLWTGCR